MTPDPGVLHHTLHVQVSIFDRELLEHDGHAFFQDNGGDNSPRTISQCVLECLMFGGSPADHGFEIADVE